MIANQVETSVQSHARLKSIRQDAGLSASELAAQAGVSRQTIYAIEDGTFMPNTLVALRLARALNVRVEEIFTLRGDASVPEKPVWADLLTGDPHAVSEGQLVRLNKGPKDLVAIPVQATSNFLPAADGVIECRRGSRVLVKTANSADKRTGMQKVILAGCDPALSFLSELAQPLGIDLITVPASSSKALLWLKQGRVQIAGSHLLDRATGEYNLPTVKRLFPQGGMLVSTFALWEEGLVTRPGNPKQIHSIADLGEGDIKIANREKGSGSRAQLEEALRTSGIAAANVPGYRNIAYGHLPAAFAVATGTADCCLATRSAARCYGLHFTPLRTERFDLVAPWPFFRTRSGKIISDLLNHAILRQKLQNLAGYSTTQTGQVLTRNTNS